MPPSSSGAVSFASSNRRKFLEASAILGPGIGLRFLRSSPEEIQSGSIRAISRHKARSAFARHGRRLIVEDDGLEIDSLGGFPGPYSSFVFGTIGNAGILRLVGRDRGASFVSVVTFCDGEDLVSFEARVAGRISRSARGRGWGYDPIFVPAGAGGTFAELGGRKNSVSHRYRALTKFAGWFGRRRRSACPRTSPRSAARRS